MIKLGDSVLFSGMTRVAIFVLPIIPYLLLLSGTGRAVFLIFSTPKRLARFLVDMMTSEPSFVEKVADASSATNCCSVNALFSEGVLCAKNGKLAIFTGGDETVSKRLDPIFALLMGKANYMGRSGTGKDNSLSRWRAIRSQIGPRCQEVSRGDLDWSGRLEIT